MGVELLDLGFQEQWVVVDLLLNRPVPGLPNRSLNICDPSRPMTAIPIPGSRFRFEVMCLPGEDPVELQRPETVLPLLTRWIPAGAATIERSAVYTFHGLLASRWRSGRVLIGGDAAHQMPPFLGQGMCSGLRDVANLAWKLAAILRHNVTESVLDTYELERIPHVRAIIEAAIDAGKITCMLDPVESAAMHRAILSDSAPPERRFAFSLPKLRRGPLVGDGGGDLFVQPAGANGHKRLDDRIGQRFLVMGRSEEAIGAHGAWWAQAVGALVTTVDQLPESAILARWLNDRKANVVVVRPDHYVLYSGKDLGAITAMIRDALAERRDALNA
jgi:3-(3-hydroxy-phenyl)propionate hydroxylase